MTYHAPIGYLGASDQYASLSDAEVRREAERIGTRIFQHYDRVKTQAQPLMSSIQWSDEAFAEGRELMRRITQGRVSIPIPTRAYGAVMKRQVAQMGITAVKAKRMVYSSNVRNWMPVLVRMANAQERMAAEIDRMGRSVRESSGGTSGLGFVPVLLFVPHALFVLVSWAVVDSFMGAAEELDEVAAYVERMCGVLQRQTGRPCDATDMERFANMAREIQRSTGLPNRVMSAIEENTNNLTQGGGPIDRLVSRVGTAGIVAIAGGAVVLTGLGIYALWPYLATVREAGKKVQRKRRVEG